MMQRSQAIPKVTGKIGAYISPPKLSNFLTGLVIFFSATQLGLHFWPLSSLVYGIRIDYLAPTIYFLDLLIIAHLVLKRPNLVSHPRWASLTGAALPTLLLNLLFSSNPFATLTWSLRLVLYVCFLATLGPKPQGVIQVALTGSLLFQLTLTVIQALLGHSVGGLMYYLGERAVAVGAPAIATATFMSETILRGYGTFGHPNVLAGWLVVCLLIILTLFRSLKSSIGYWSLIMTTVFASLGVLLTQSRAGALALFGLVIPFYLLNSLRYRLLYFAALLIAVCCSLFTGPLARDLDLSLSERLSLQHISAQIIQASPLFGAGANASISLYPTLAPTVRNLQPDHNSFSLFLSWFGLFGILAFLPILKSKILNLKSFLPLLPLLLLDHYFLTSPQGLFILLLYAKLSSCSK